MTILYDNFSNKHLENLLHSRAIILLDYNYIANRGKEN